MAQAPGVSDRTGGQAHAVGTRCNITDNPDELPFGRAERMQGAETYLLCRRFLNDDDDEEEDRYEWR